MRKDPVILNQKEQRRARVVGEVEGGRMSMAEAAQLLKLSERQVRRLRAAARTEGPAAFMHGNRGRPSARRITDELR